MPNWCAQSFDVQGSGPDVKKFKKLFQKAFKLGVAPNNPDVSWMVRLTQHPPEVMRRTGNTHMFIDEDAFISCFIPRPDNNFPTQPGCVWNPTYNVLSPIESGDGDDDDDDDDNKEEKKCENCGAIDKEGANEEPLLQCSGCKRVLYCSIECQREHWVDGGHKAACLPTHISIVLTSKWKPVYTEVELQRMVRKFPKLRIEFKYAEVGMMLCGQIVCDGATSSSNGEIATSMHREIRHDELPSLNHDDDDDDDSARTDTFSGPFAELLPMSG